jgi:hypothetical protein
VHLAHKISFSLYPGNARALSAIRQKKHSIKVSALRMVVRMLFVQKACVIMAACVYLFITDRSASVLLDFLVKDVRLT